jgi:hypothetical protein
MSSVSWEEHAGISVIVDIGSGAPCNDNFQGGIFKHDRPTSPVSDNVN